MTFLFANYFKYFLQCATQAQKNQNVFNYFHKPKIEISPQKIWRKVLRNEFSSGETVYVGTQAVCGKDHKRASATYGCKYINQNVIVDVPTWHSSPKRQKQGKNVRSVIGCVLFPSGDCRSLWKRAGQ